LPRAVLSPQLLDHRDGVLDPVNRESPIGERERQTSSAHPELEHRPRPGKLAQAADGRLSVGDIPVEGVVAAGCCPAVLIGSCSGITAVVSG
jgi:hypothetical protein